MLSFQIKASFMYIGLKWVCQPEIGYTTPRFFQNQHPTIRLSLHCSITMVGGHEKQSESNTTSTSSSASASAVSADWDIAPPLQNIRVDTQYVGINGKKNNKLGSFRKNWLSSIVSDIEHCQKMQAGGRML